MIRVLIADDSPVAQELLAAILALDPEIQVVGQAKDGVEAVQLTKKRRPDLVIMDARMPRMDGFQATKEIMIEAATPIIIVSASLNTRDVAVSMDALSAGALTVLAKPAGPASPQFEEEAEEFLRTVRAMSQVKVVSHHRLRTTPLPPAPAPPPPSGPRERVIAIATSTGGPAALARVFSGLPPDFPAPILVVQHIAPAFTEGLAVWLGTVCRLKVKVAREGEALHPGVVYIAPEDRHLGLSSLGTVALSAAAPVGGFRPSGTTLFQSVAKAYGNSTVGVIMTGMGEDGVEGLRAVRQAGGYIIAQDEASSVVFGMPGVAIACGLYDVILSLDLIAPRLLALARQPVRSGAS